MPGLNNELEKRISTSIEELNKVTNILKIGRNFVHLSEMPSCPFYLGLINTDGVWHWVNQHFVDDLGLDKDDVIGKLYTDFIVDGKEELLDTFKEGLDSLVYTGYPAVYKLKDGERVVEWWNTEVGEDGLILCFGFVTGNYDKYEYVRETNNV